MITDPPDMSPEYHQLDCTDEDGNEHHDWKRIGSAGDSDFYTCRKCGESKEV